MSSNHPQNQPPPQPDYYAQAEYQNKQKNANNKILIGVLIACGSLFLLAILGIVAAVMIPMFLSSNTASKNEKARNTLRSLISAEAAYFAHNGNYGSLSELVDNGFLVENFSQDPADKGNKVVLELEVDEDKQGFTAFATGKTAKYETSEKGDIYEVSFY